MKHGRAMVAVVALSAALTACGSSGTGGTLAPAALLAMANAICTTASRDGASIGAPAHEHGVAAAAKYFDRVAPIIDRETRSLEALMPASGVKASWDAFVAKQLAADTLMQSIRHEADGNGTSLNGSLQKVRPATQAVIDAASALGAKTCAR
jgi:hypothetical protein